MAIPSHSQIMSGFKKLPEEEEEEKVRQIPTHEQIVKRTKVPEVEEEPTGIFGKLRGVARGVAKFAARTGVEAANLVSSTVDFFGDFVAGKVEQRTRRPSIPLGPLVSIPIGEETEERKKAADRWRDFYERTAGGKTEELKEFTEGLREAEFIQPSEEWTKASIKEKFTTRLPETVFNVGPGVVASLGAFAINPALGFTVSMGSVADEIETLGVESGLGEETAANLALGTGLLVGWIDKMVPDEIFSPVQKREFLSAIARRVFKTSLKELGTEVVQEDIQLIVEGALREDLTTEEIVERNLMAGLGGLIGGSGAQTMVSFVNNVRSGDIGGVTEEDVAKVKSKIDEKTEGIEPETLTVDVDGYKGIKKAGAVFENETAVIRVEANQRAQRTEVVSDLESQLREKGITQAKLLTDDNEVGEYAKLGYKSIGKTSDGIVVMRKDLPAIELAEKPTEMEEIGGFKFVKDTGEIAKSAKVGTGEYEIGEVYQQVVNGVDKGKVVVAGPEKGGKIPALAFDKSGKEFPLAVPKDQLKPYEAKGEPAISKAVTKELEPLAEEARKFKSAEEFVETFSMRRYLEDKGIKVNPDNTVDIYHITFPDIAKRIKNTGFLKPSTGPVGGMVGEKIGEASFATPTRELAKKWGSGKRNSIIKLKVPVKDIRHGAENLEEFYFEGGLKRESGGIWRPVKKTSTFVDRLAKNKYGQQLTDFYNQATGRVETEAKPKEEVRVAKEIIQLKEKVIKEKIRTTKDIKGVRSTLKSIRQELDNAVTEAEGRAVVAQEQRAGLNIEDINKLKRIYAINKKFQEGDIETIRASKKVGPLLNRTLENIQERYPHFSEQEAFDFALNLPTKADERGRTSEIVQLEKKEKKLREYMDQLRAKQKKLNIEEDELLTKEWESVLAAQERLIELIKVPGTQLPVGEGVERVSRLEARVKGVLGRFTKEEQENLGLSTYRQMNKADQVARASRYASENTSEALRVLKGEIDPPPGLLRNSIYVALKELGAADTQIATQVASLASTRMGQEISILSEIDKDSPVSLMEDVVKARIEGYERRGKDVKKLAKRESGKIEIKKASGKDWDSFLASIRC